MSNNRLHNRISDMESSSEFRHVFDGLPLKNIKCGKILWIQI